MRAFLQRRKYETLLAALLLHLFNAVLLPDLRLYERIFWPLDMVLLGVCSYGVFVDRHGVCRLLKNALAVVVILFPLVALVVPRSVPTMAVLSVCYVAFYGLVFVAVMRFLVRPSYINTDIVSAAICGYLLLIDVGIFVMQTVHYLIPNSFHNIATTSFTAAYLDIVYYCCITVTSIGFGDILPTHHISKLATAMLGITGQFYSVVLVGLIISKYSASAGPPSPPAARS